MFSAGASNSQESFPSGGQTAPGQPMDGYSGQYAPYPPQPNQPQGKLSRNTYIKIPRTVMGSAQVPT